MCTSPHQTKRYVTVSIPRACGHVTTQFPLHGTLRQRRSEYAKLIRRPCLECQLHASEQQRVRRLAAERQWVEQQKAAAQSEGDRWFWGVVLSDLERGQSLYRQATALANGPVYLYRERGQYILDYLYAQEG